MNPRTAPGWGHHCAEPVAAAVAAASGRDVWAELGGCPRGWREAADLFRRLGARTLAEAVTAVLGPPLPSPRLARRGDVVMVRGGLGLCRGEVAECLPATVPMAAADLAWPVAPRSPALGASRTCPARPRPEGRR